MGMQGSVQGNKSSGGVGTDKVVRTVTQGGGNACPSDIKQEANMTCPICEQDHTSAIHNPTFGEHYCACATCVPQATDSTCATHGCEVCGLSHEDGHSFHCPPCPCRAALTYTRTEEAPVMQSKIERAQQKLYIILNEDVPSVLRLQHKARQARTFLALDLNRATSEAQIKHHKARMHRLTQQVREARTQLINRLRAAHEWVYSQLGLSPVERTTLRICRDMINESLTSLNAKI